MQISKEELLALMRAGKIPGLAVSSVIDGKPTEAMALGLANRSSNTSVTTETVFEAASLTKPIFTRVVLKLAQSGEFDIKQKFGDIEGIDELLAYQQLSDNEARKNLTAEWVLSHRTGLPNVGEAPFQFQFKPGAHFRYSGCAYYLLQKIIEQRTGKTLEALARELVFEPLAMHHTHFYRPSNLTLAVHHNAQMLTSLPLAAPPLPVEQAEGTAVAAGSLYTTASDFALFMADCLNDQDPVMQSAFDFTQGISMLEDGWAVEAGVSQADLEKIHWGLGWGLLNTPEGIVAFHWGDNGDSKAFVAMNLTQRTGIVYFANSWNGLSIAQEIIASTVKHCMPVFNYLFKKYGYADYKQSDWQQVSDIDTFGKYELNNAPGWDEKLKQQVAERIAAQPQSFGKYELEYTPGWEQRLQQHIAKAIARQPFTGLETFMQMILERPTTSLGVAQTNQRQDSGYRDVTQRGESSHAGIAEPHHSTKNQEGKQSGHWARRNGSPEVQVVNTDKQESDSDIANDSPQGTLKK